MRDRSTTRKYPVIACKHKGNPKRFFGKYKDPKTGRWLKIPGGPFSPAVDTHDKALACAARWYEAEFLANDRPRKLTTWMDACDGFVEEVGIRLRGSDATKDEARMKASALRSNAVLNRKPLAQHDEALALAWLRSFAAEVVPKRAGLQAPRDPLTIRNYTKILREVYRFAHRHGALSPTCPAPAEGAEFDQELRALIAKKPKREFMLEADVIVAVFAAPTVSDFRKVWLGLLAYTGMRPGEAHGLKLGDLRVSNRIRYLRVERQFKLPRTKVPARFGSVKTKNANRLLPVHPDLWVRLHAWLETGWAAYVGRQPTPEDVILPTPDGKPFREERADEFRDMLAEMNLPTSFAGIPLTPYAIRHTFSTLAKRVGIPDEDRDYLMGHTPKSTRATNYDVNDVRYLYSQIRKLPTFTAAGLKEFEERINALDDIDEAELAPTG